MKNICLILFGILGGLFAGAVVTDAIAIGPLSRYGFAGWHSQRKGASGSAYFEDTYYVMDTATGMIESRTYR